MEVLPFGRVIQENFFLAIFCCMERRARAFMGVDSRAFLCSSSVH